MLHYLILNLIKSIPPAINEVVRSSISHLMPKTTIKISDQEVIENSSNLVVTTSADGFEAVTYIGVVKEANDSEVEAYSNSKYELGSVI